MLKYSREISIATIIAAVLLLGGIASYYRGLYEDLLKERQAEVYINVTVNQQP